MTNSTILPPPQSTLDIGEDSDIERSDEVQASAAPRRGRPRGSRQAAGREQARNPARSNAVVLGRNGEQLSRKRTSTSDIFHIPAELIPEGWEYQWCAVTVIGNSEILMDQNLMMAENGWRPVPADRYPGRFMPTGHKGNITRGGQLLMERPSRLCQEAREEEIAAAKQQMTDRDQSLMGGKANLRGAMQNGITMGGRYRGTGGDVRMTIDPALDIPAPQHTLAEPGE